MGLGIRGSWVGLDWEVGSESDIIQIAQNYNHANWLYLQV